MRRINMLPALLAMTMFGASIAAPAQALKPPPKDTPTGSSSGGTPVPEPSSMILFGAGAAAFMLTKRRKQTRD